MEQELAQLRQMVADMANNGKNLEPVPGRTHWQNGQACITVRAVFEGSGKVPNR